jgi:hypothetical protein
VSDDVDDIDLQPPRAAKMPKTQENNAVAEAVLTGIIDDLRKTKSFKDTMEILKTRTFVY